MKNKLLLIIIIYILEFFVAKHCDAQVIEHKIQIKNFLTGDFMPNKQSSSNGFIYPYLFPNMTGLNGYSTKATYKIHPLFSLGVEASKMIGTEWSLNNSKLYDGAEVNLQSLAPVFQVHTKFHEMGIFNHLKIYGEVAPVLGQSKLQLQNPIFKISSEINADEKLTKSIDNYFGFKAGAGLELVLYRNLGMQVEYSFRQNRITSALFVDDKFSSTQFIAGLFFRFKKNKRYSY